MKKYNNLNYINQSRLQAYIEQVKYLDNKVTSILEVGKGAGIFESIVKNAGITYVGADYDTSTQPDVALDVVNLPFHDASFDVVYCCQVLEHLTFDKFDKSMSELCRVARRKVILSLPDNRKAIRFSLTLPRINYKKIFSIPKTGKNLSEDALDKHYWEVGDTRYKSNVPEVEILRLLKQIADNWQISHYRLFERPYQHFFILNKNVPTR